MPDIAWNLKVWDKTYAWPKDGDEWTEQAQFCGVPYESWKESLAQTFLIPHLKKESVVIEIGPGHGRWTHFIAPRVTCGTVHLVDISQSCLDYCLKNLITYGFNFLKNDGRTLPKEVLPGSVDFIWSFDTFVHIEEPEIRSYARELFRVLKPQGMGVIHHAGNPTPQQRQNGARSLAGTRLFGDIFREAGFFMIRQTDEWNGGNLKLTGDVISVFVKP